MSRLARSYLYVPGDQPQWMDKAAECGADALILDLEDAVAPERKDVGRRNVRKFVCEPRTGPELWVRVNGEYIEVDIEAVGHSSLAGIVLPGATRAQLERADQALSKAEQVSGLKEGSFRIIALIETAGAVLSLSEIARHPRVIRLGIGEVDLAGELGLRPDDERTELWPIRSAIVVASAAAGIASPIGPVDVKLNSVVGLTAGTQRQLRQGFRARTAIHPNQVRIINEIFTPSLDEIAAATEILQKFERAIAGGNGVSRTSSGEMIDVATVRSAREVLARSTDDP